MWCSTEAVILRRFKKRLMNGYGDDESSNARRRVARGVIGNAVAADYINRSLKAQDFSLFAISVAIALAKVFCDIELVGSDGKRERRSSRCPRAADNKSIHSALKLSEAAAEIGPSLDVS